MNALAGFLDGVGDSLETKKKKKESDAQTARLDAAIARLGATPQNPQAGPPTGGTDPGGAPSHIGGYGRAPQQMQQGYGDGSLLALRDATEGGGRYDTLFGHAQRGGAFDGVDVSKMTIGQLKEFSDPNGQYGQWVKGRVGHVATPMGRHQIVGTTLRAAAKDMGMPDNVVFTDAVQDQMADHLTKRRLSSASSPLGKMAALRAEWDGFRHVPDADLMHAINLYEQNGGVVAQPSLGAARRPR